MITIGANEDFISRILDVQSYGKEQNLIRQLRSSKFHSEQAVAVLVDFHL
jgi:hypothetical protein